MIENERDLKKQIEFLKQKLITTPSVENQILESVEEYPTQPFKKQRNHHVK